MKSQIRATMMISAAAVPPIFNTSVKKYSKKYIWIQVCSVGPKFARGRPASSLTVSLRSLD